jgi:hypothetical protein
MNLLEATNSDDHLAKLLITLKMECSDVEGPSFLVGAIQTYWYHIEIHKIDPSNIK